MLGLFLLLWHWTIRHQHHCKYNSRETVILKLVKCKIVLKYCKNKIHVVKILNVKTFTEIISKSLVVRNRVICTGKKCHANHEILSDTYPELLACVASILSIRS